MSLDKSLDEIIAGRNPRVSKPSSRRPRPGRSSYSHDTRDRRMYRDEASARNATVMISNLFYDLTEADLQGLFTQVGDIRDLKIQYDQSGRSEGVAWITFSSAREADAAIAQFNGKKAAGQYIRITKAHGWRHAGSRFSERLDQRDRQDRQDRRDRRDRRDQDGPSGPRARGGNGRQAGTESAPRARKTVEELDAELDAYMNGPSEPVSEAASETVSVAAEPANGTNDSTTQN